MYIFCIYKNPINLSFFLPNMLFLVLTPIFSIFFLRQSFITFSHALMNSLAKAFDYL